MGGGGGEGGGGGGWGGRSGGSCAGDRAEQYGRLAERGGEFRQARLRCEEIETELAALQVPGDGAKDETAEEVDERRDVASALKELLAQHEQQAKYYRQTLDRLDAAPAVLPSAFDEQGLAAAQRAVLGVRAGGCGAGGGRPSASDPRRRNQDSAGSAGARTPPRAPGTGDPRGPGRSATGKLEAAGQLPEQRRRARAGNRRWAA